MAAPAISYNNMSFSLTFRDNIQTVRLNTKGQDSFYGNGIVTLGYYNSNGPLGRWSWSPNRQGNIPDDQETQLMLSDIFKNFQIALNFQPTVKVYSSFCSIFGEGIKSGDIDEAGDYQYAKGIDKNNRNFVLVPCNDGMVPVRHGTDPACGIWTSERHRTRIVYDNNRFRHPACEEIDYAEHGLVLHGKSWWPIKNGPFEPSLFRLTSPYYPDYQQIYSRLETPSHVPSIALGAVVAIATRSPSLGVQAAQVVRGNSANQIPFEELRIKYQAQKNMIDGLNDEDERVQNR